MNLGMCIIVLSSLLLTINCKGQISKTKESDKKHMNSNKLLELQGEDLVHIVFQNIAEEIWIDRKIDFQYFTELPLPKQVIYKTYLLEMEVNNGGFNQYYHNRGIEIAENIPEYLEEIGALNYANLVLRANELYKKEYKLITKDQNGTLEGFSKSYEDNPLNKLDSQFTEKHTGENIMELQTKYIKENIAEFE